MKWSLGQNHTHGREEAGTCLSSTQSHRGGKGTHPQKHQPPAERQSPNPHPWLCYGLGVVHSSTTTVPSMPLGAL